MMLFLALPIAILCLAVLANRRRKARQYHYELTPNCLLTRWPVLFVSGRRSVFYFSKYWNVYPEFLTEHGYEVYSLHLPWSNTHARAQNFRRFLQESQKHNRRYHLVLDPETQHEFSSLLSNGLACIASVNTLKDSMVVHSPLGGLQSISYKFHAWRFGNKGVASPHALGVSARASLKNAAILLHLISSRAEEDFQSEYPLPANTEHGVIKPCQTSVT